MNKKILFVVVACASLLLSSCGRSDDAQKLAQENESLKSQSATELSENFTVAPTAKLPSLDTAQNTSPISSSDGQTAEVKTDHGDYNVTVLSASKAKELEQDGNYPIIISMEIENISYDYGDQSDKYLMPWSHSRGGIKVADNNKNILKIYDVRGPQEVHYPENIPAGYKEIANFAFFPVTPNVMPSSVEVQICNNNSLVKSITLPVTE